MGGCVLSTLQKRNQWSVEEDKEITSFSNYGPLTETVPNSETSYSSAIYRNGKYSTDTAIETFKEGAIASLLPSVIKKVCAEEPNRVACRYRNVLSVTKEDPPIPPLFSSKVTKVDVYNMSEPIGVSYGEFWSTIRGVGSGLAAAGVPNRGNVCIFEDTRWEWTAAVFAIWTQDFVACTVYANLGEDALYYALKETEASAIICNGKNVPLLLNGIEVGHLPPCVIVYLDALPAGSLEETHGCTVLSWEDVIEKGRQNPAEEQLPTDPDATALIMYTSGTTGDPKGVIHTHGTFTTGVQCLSNWVFGNVTAQPDDMYISFLPLAHILALGVVCIFFSYKVVVCFGTPRTLTDTTARPSGDLSTFKPTFIIGVPRIFDTVRRNVIVRLPAPGTLARNVFEQAYAARREAMLNGKDTPFYNEKVFKQAREALGGRLRLILAGGGPISEDTQDFIRVIFGKAVVGWGLTETVCVGAVQQLGDITNGNTGLPLVSAEIRLDDTEDYKHTDQPEPRGELCIRGPFLFKGYYKQPELTKAAIDEEGWFHTGDVGSITEGGRIKIVGRIKALAKNCLGEYIALETLESIYAAHPLVANNCICVLVHPNRNYIGAVLVSDEEKVGAFAHKHNIQITGDDSLNDPALQKKVVEEFMVLAKAAHRVPFEFIKKVILTTGEWTPENGILTAATKLKRRSIDEKYKEEIEQLFKEGE